jgi:DNA-directed RNA polymerase specialized sigma24 family protein
VRAEGGRFRSFLLRALQNHESHVRERAGALKRGGDRQQFQLDSETPVNFDQQAAEARYMAEPATNETPETLYERRFAEALIEKALGDLRAEEEAKGAAEEFDLISPFLAGDLPAGGYAQLSQGSGRSEGSLKVAVHRLRKRWRQGLLTEIARQVDRPRTSRRSFTTSSASVAVGTQRVATVAENNHPPGFSACGGPLQSFCWVACNPPGVFRRALLEGVPQPVHLGPVTAR